LLRERGHIGFLGHNDYVEFRNIRIKELPAKRKDNAPPEGFAALFNGKDLTAGKVWWTIRLNARNFPRLNWRRTVQGRPAYAGILEGDEWNACLHR